MSEPPVIAVLGHPPHVRTAAAALALAAARALGRSCALVGGVGSGASGSLAAAPGARRAAAALQRCDLPATASGRLVRLADRRGEPAEADVAGRLAAVSAELGRAARRVGVPAAVALPLPRTAPLDRVLAWHDAVVVVRDGAASEALVAQALASIGRLGLPAVALAPPRRLPAALARAGLHAPPEALAAVAALGLGRAEGRTGDRADG